MRGGDDRGAALAELGEGRQARPDASVVGDLAVPQRDVQVEADEDASAGEVAEILERSETHGR
jgi:hypothetical protein